MNTTAEVDEYLMSLERQFELVRVPPYTQNLNLAERGQKKLLMLLNLNLHAGRLSLLAWQDMMTATEGQLVFHPLPDAEAAWRKDISRYEAFFGRKPDASTWIAAPGQAVYCRIDDARLSSGDDMSEAAYFIRPSAESKGFMVRTILGREVRTTRNVLVVRNPTARLAQLALSDDLARTYGPPRRTEAYHDAMLSLFDQFPNETLIRPLILEDPLSKVMTRPPRLRR